MPFTGCTHVKSKNIHFIVKAMKKIFFYTIVLCLIYTSCNEAENIEYNDEDMQVVSEIRSFEEALQIALAATTMADNQTATRGLSPKRVISLSDSKIIRERVTRSSANVLDTLMYVFNFEDSAGFAIVAGPKSAEGLLAVTEFGYYDPNVPCQVVGFNDFIKRAKSYCINAYYNPASEEKKYLQMTRTPVGSTEEYMDSTWYVWTPMVSPLIHVLWGQTHPEGEFCPNGIAGCSNTAMAQIMSFFEYPDSIPLTYPNADKTYEVLNWYSMKMHSTGHLLDSCPKPGVHTSIGRLLRELGQLCNSTYYNSDLGTGTYTEQYAGNAFNYLGYSVGEWKDYTRAAACASLDASRPLLVTGVENWISGHAWVLDGYFTLTRCTQRMRRIPNSAWFPVGIKHAFTSWYMHQNWGWYGDCNGYFLSGVFDTSAAFEPPFTRSDYPIFGDVKMLSVYR